MYDYYWVPEALEELADIFVASDIDEQDRMAAGVEAFNAGLVRDPFDLGESRDGERRVALLPLLAVRFEIDKEGRRVQVNAVARFGC